MVAGTDPQKSARAILCYQQQSWEQKELIVIDNGITDLSPLLEDITTDELRYIKKPNNNSRANLKNLGLDHADGDYVIHWDVLDWHHPDRICEQWDAIAAAEDNEYSLLGSTLLHLDHPEFVHHPMIDSPTDGYSGSLMHRNRIGLRYPAKKRNPDRAFFKLWSDAKGKKLNIEHAHLVVRSLDSGDPASRRRFTSGFQGNAGDVARSAWIALRGKNVLSHRRFRLCSQQRDSFQRFLKESQKLGLITSISG